MWNMFAQDMKYAMEGRCFYVSLGWGLSCVEVRLSSFFSFLFDIQSMRRTACVRAQIIWTCTSRSSGSTTSTARSSPLSRSTFLNIQRKYRINSIQAFLPVHLPLWFKDSCSLSSVLVLQLVWTICHHVARREWRSVPRFSTWSSGEGQKRRGNCFHLYSSHMKWHD